MKAIAAAVLLSAFTASAAQPWLPQPVLVPLIEPAPIEPPLAVHKQWWFYAIWATATVQTGATAFATFLAVAVFRAVAFSSTNPR